MKLPRVRFTVRRLMVAVAAIGLLLAAHGFLQRRAIYLKLAEECEVAERALSLAERRVRNSTKDRASEPNEYSPDDLRDMTLYYRQRKERYRLAALYPWLPDPREPSDEPE